MANRIKTIQSLLEKTPDDVFLHYSLGMRASRPRVARPSRPRRPAKPGAPPLISPQRHRPNLPTRLPFN
jgi:hypothetical protein